MKYFLSAAIVVAALQGAAQQRSLLVDSLPQHLINKPSPEFVLMDADGKQVSLSDFKGKTIILDFWANWCGPCKKSFPAMQRVVNKYKNDPSVKFLFILTWESSKTPLEEAKVYLSANNFHFDLYIDPKENDSRGSNKSAALFGFRGIPQKYVIDGRGQIQFNITGFSGSDDDAVQELSLMIDYAKKQVL
ncbi:TlpA family protein disulfide reductase [Parasegetibacter sp. MAH-26]|uniref:TlpA family protein disulfide reductase n=1 Tax=Pinibacter aurantiacus TaxID=2851599 RepID=A0A9E2SE29_9BACT|nr:TlpA family protein disulfide reductase [Pinibacter aurantiacus]